MMTVRIQRRRCMLRPARTWSSKLPFEDMAHIKLSYDFDHEKAPGSVFKFQVGNLRKAGAVTQVFWSTDPPLLRPLSWVSAPGFIRWVSKACFFEQRIPENSLFCTY